MLDEGVIMRFNTVLVNMFKGVVVIVFFIKK